MADSGDLLSICYSLLFLRLIYKKVTAEKTLETASQDFGFLGSMVSAYTDFSWIPQFLITASLAI